MQHKGEFFKTLLLKTLMKCFMLVLSAVRRCGIKESCKT